MLLRTAKAFLLLSFPLNAALAASASSSDLRLIQMVPPESQVIASMRGPKLDGQPSSFLLFTANNRTDFEDFLAVTGADASRRIRQVIFAAEVGDDGILSEHSLLISGHFNHNAIFRFGESGNATIESYRGEAILVIPPLARERSRFRQLRWLAILNSDIAIFGTPVSVQQELDRRIANSRPDSSLMERLSRLDGRDETWCLLPTSSPGGIVKSTLDKLDPKLGSVAGEGGPVQYGIHFGRQVEITASSNNVVRVSSKTENNRSATHSIPTTYFLAGSLDDEDIHQKFAIVKISRRCYSEWLNRVSQGQVTIQDNPDAVW
jgi:hypothetical protein